LLASPAGFEPALPP